MHDQDWGRGQERGFRPCWCQLPSLWYSRKISGLRDHNSIACDFSLWPGTRPMALQIFISLVQKMSTTLFLS